MRFHKESFRAWNEIQVKKQTAPKPFAIKKIPSAAPDRNALFYTALGKATN